MHRRLISFYFSFLPYNHTQWFYYYYAWLFFKWTVCTCVWFFFCIQCQSENGINDLFSSHTFDILQRELRNKRGKFRRRSHSIIGAIIVIKSCSFSIVQVKRAFGGYFRFHKHSTERNKRHNHVVYVHIKNIWACYDFLASTEKKSLSKKIDNNEWMNECVAIVKPSKALRGKKVDIR
jgi:hypothetical protein